MGYTTAQYISDELNGFVINQNSIPNSTTVARWIQEADSLINERTGKIWEEIEYEEIHDYNGSGFLKLNHYPILEITELEYEANGLQAESEKWITLSEGRGPLKHFIVYKDEGEIEFTKSGIPTYGYQNVKVTYTAGFDVVPYYIQRLSTAIVSKRVILSIINGSASEEGGSVSVGTISVTDPSAFGHNHLRALTEEINELFKTANFKNYNITRNY